MLLDEPRRPRVVEEKADGQSAATTAGVIASNIWPV